MKGTIKKQGMEMADMEVAKIITKVTLNKEEDTTSKKFSVDCVCVSIF